MINRDVFSFRLKALRQKHELSGHELSQMVGLKTRASISQFEAGKNIPSAEIFAELADLFCVSLDYLIGRTDDPQTEFFVQASEDRLFDRIKNLENQEKADRFRSIYCAAVKPLSSDEKPVKLYLSHKFFYGVPDDSLNESLPTRFAKYIWYAFFT